MNMDRREEPLEGHPRYQKLEDLGAGAFGFVQLAVDRESGEKVAIKFLLRGPKINRNVEREIFNHRKLLHNHVVQFKGVFLTAWYLGIVLEYAPGGDLLTFLQARGGITEDVGRWFFQQLMIGLDYIHRMGVASRDIKLENTLLDDKEWPLVKICDFGYSKGDAHSLPKSLVGTRPYLAPEVVATTRGGTYNGKRADIWSSGVFLYVLLLGAYPFERPGDPPNDNGNVIERITAVDYSIPEGKISAEAADLIRRILVKEPERRLSIAEIQAHAWYQVNLPEGATEMNNMLVEQTEQNLQPEADIRAILAEAAVSPSE